MANLKANSNPLKEVLNPITAYLTADNNIDADPAAAYNSRNSTFNAVSELLKSLLNPNSVKAITEGTKNHGSDSLGISGVGASGQGNNTVFPSFNLRTPIVTIALNGTEIYPLKPNLDIGVQDENSPQ